MQASLLNSGPIFIFVLLLCYRSPDWPSQKDSGAIKQPVRIPVDISQNDEHHHPHFRTRC